MLLALKWRKGPGNRGSAEGNREGAGCGDSGLSSQHSQEAEAGELQVKAPSEQLRDLVRLFLKKEKKKIEEGG